MSEQAKEAQTGEKLVCPANPEPAVKKFIMAGLLLAWALYCAYDLYWHANPLKPGDEHYEFTYYTMLPAFPLAVVPLVWGILQLRRKLVADGEGLGFSQGNKVRWDSITRLEPLGKGQLEVHYTQDGRDGTLKLDSYFIKNFNELVRMIEAKRPDVPAGESDADDVPEPDQSEK